MVMFSEAIGCPQQISVMPGLHGREIWLGSASSDKQESCA